VTRAVLLIGFITLVWSGCGVVGSPIAPENVGVAPILERQKQREAAAAGLSGEVPSSPDQTMGTEFGAGGAVEPAEDLPVPPTQSVGTGVGMR
jgi:hypothetical protein